VTHLYEKGPLHVPFFSVNATSIQQMHFIFIQPAVVESTGVVTFAVPARVDTGCDLNYNLFPWDEHVCTIHFGSWTKDTGHLTLSQDDNATVAKVSKQEGHAQQESSCQISNLCRGRGLAKVCGKSARSSSINFWKVSTLSLWMILTPRRKRRRGI